ncbi:MAG: hypothetical protein ABI720_09705 [Actinomycetes bacterium]
MAAFTWGGHALGEKEGGLAVVLSDAGCLGSGEGEPTGAACARTAWFYIHWWVWTVGVFAVGLLISPVVAHIALTTGHDQSESDDEPLGS